MIETGGLMEAHEIMKITGKRFGERLVAEYVRHTGNEADEVAARNWFAALCRQHPKSVLRWTQADVVGEGPHITLLLLIEAQPAAMAWAAEPEKLASWAKTRREALTAGGRATAQNGRKAAAKKKVPKAAPT